MEVSTRVELRNLRYRDYIGLKEAMVQAYSGPTRSVVASRQR
ncbi:MAG TPA: hypothetical protein PLI34_15450 [Saprospiraceae bacterium]|nr:hypothetical protein [Saprospiraceae bacterium]